MIQSTTERWSYYTLLGSLPPLPPSFDVARLPISRPRLEERLATIPAVDRDDLDLMRGFLFWERQKIDLTEDMFIRRHDEFLAKVHNPVVREIVEFRLDLRSIVAAIRRRRLGMPAGAPVGRWHAMIHRHAGDVSFGLANRFPWIPRLDRAIKQEHVDEANRIILGVAYRQWSTMAVHHHFSFEALALYVARWDVVDRWVSRSLGVGRERLEQLVTEAMGDHQRLF